MWRSNGVSLYSFHFINDMILEPKFCCVFMPLVPHTTSNVQDVLYITFTPNRHSWLEDTLNSNNDDTNNSCNVTFLLLSVPPSRARVAYRSRRWLRTGRQEFDSRQGQRFPLPPLCPASLYIAVTFYWSRAARK